MEESRKRGEKRRTGGETGNRDENFVYEEGGAGRKRKENVKGGGGKDSESEMKKQKQGGGDSAWEMLEKEERIGLTVMKRKEAAEVLQKKGTDEEVKALCEEWMKEVRRMGQEELEELLVDLTFQSPQKKKKTTPKKKRSAEVQQSEEVGGQAKGNGEKMKQRLGFEKKEGEKGRNEDSSDGENPPNVCSDEEDEKERGVGKGGSMLEREELHKIVKMLVKSDKEKEHGVSLDGKGGFRVGGTKPEDLIEYPKLAQVLLQQMMRMESEDELMAYLKSPDYISKAGLSKKPLMQVRGHREKKMIEVRLAKIMAELEELMKGEEFTQKGTAYAEERDAWLKEWAGTMMDPRTVHKKVKAIMQQVRLQQWEHQVAEDHAGGPAEGWAVVDTVLQEVTEGSVCTQLGSKKVAEAVKQVQKQRKEAGSKGEKEGSWGGGQGGGQGKKKGAGRGRQGLVHEQGQGFQQKAGKCFSCAGDHFWTDAICPNYQENHRQPMRQAFGGGFRPRGGGRGNWPGYGGGRGRGRG